MQLLGDGSWVVSASDLSAHAACPWRVARTADDKLGKGVHIPGVEDPMMDLVARLGLEHEARQWQMLSQSLGDVIEIPYSWDASPLDAPAWRATIEAAASATRAALSSPVRAIFQGVFFQSQLTGAPFEVGFQGFADFLVHGDEGWEVWDAKLARRAKDSAVMQLAAYVDQLDYLGVPASRDVRLILGDGTHSIHDAAKLIPLYREARDALVALVHSRILDPAPTPWGDERYLACGTKGCPACTEQIWLTDDLFQVAGVRKTQRNRIRAAGFPSMTAFAEASRSEVAQRVSGIGRGTLVQLHLQASLQLASRNNPGGTPAWEVLSPSILNRIPPASDGDVFFDFEGDPTYQETDDQGRALGSLSAGETSVWFGIEYLFGLGGKGFEGEALQAGGRAETTGFRALWAENFAQEKEIFATFCTLMDARLDAYPDLHIYHYAPYERTRLQTLRDRHGIGSACVERLLGGVLVDLYPVVMKGVRIGLPGYSLKALEALYFDAGTRTGIAGGGESVVAFVDYQSALASGALDEARIIRESIIDYNRLDCLSTRELRDWLVGVRESHPID